jgi:hypothetical protein
MSKESTIYPIKKTTWLVTSDLGCISFQAKDTAIRYVETLEKGGVRCEVSPQNEY